MLILNALGTVHDNLKEAKRCGIEFMGGPQGQVLRFQIIEELALIKDIERELSITKSVAKCNLVKRMVQNGFGRVEGGPSDAGKNLFA